MSKMTLGAALVATALLNGPASGAEKMTLTSPDLKPGTNIAAEQAFKGFGCSGGNISPALSWTGAPAKTKSFALTVYDPDAPTGSGWWHWVIFNIPANVTSLPKNAGDLSAKLAPEGAIQSRTDFGPPGYGGPCPPPGKAHRYFFTIYALDVDKLPDAESDSASAALVGFDVHAHTLAKAILMGRYGR